MTDRPVVLSIDDSFQFACSAKVPCFNECCRDLNQFLTPYDIIRLKTNLGLTSTVFLERYTSKHIGPESGLPIVTLKSTDRMKLTCPFVTAAGCKVYPDRPSSCRTYPLMRALSRSRETGIVSERFMLLKESHCLGFKQDQTQTVRQWVERQGIDDYNDINDKLMEIISLKNQLKPGKMDAESNRLFFRALYDLDEFKTQIFIDETLAGIGLDADLIEKAQTNDVALLEIGMAYVKRVIFGVR